MDEENVPLTVFMRNSVQGIAPDERIDVIDGTNENAVINFAKSNRFQFIFNLKSITLWFNSYYQ